MEKVTIEAAVREGKVKARILKKDGKMPGVVYGKETKSMPIEIKIKDIEKTVKTLGEGMILITLKLTDKDKNEEKTVVIQEIQRDPATDEILHADFHQISETEKAHFKVPVFIDGIAEGVKVGGGVMEHSARDIEVRCLPSELPSKFNVDVSALEIGGTIIVGDLSVKEGVEILEDSNKVLVSIKAPTKVEEPTPEEVAAAEGEEAKQPEVITEKKEEPAEEETKK